MAKEAPPRKPKVEIVAGLIGSKTRAIRQLI